MYEAMGDRQLQQEGMHSGNEASHAEAASEMKVETSTAADKLVPQAPLVAANPLAAVYHGHSQASLLAVASNPLLLHQTAVAAGVDQQTIHNLIPYHLQQLSMAASLNGTPGYPSALIQPHQLVSPVSAAAFAVSAQTAALSAALNTTAMPTMAIQGPPPESATALTVQERPLIPPVYNGVNPHYPGLRLLNATPPIFAVDNFLSPFECQFLMEVAQDSFGPAPVVGKGAGEVSPSRTSSTCYLAREDLPDYLRKVSLLTGKPIEHCELPQVGRYFPSQQYLQHFDAFDLSNEDGRRFASNGGQRTVTVLVYLNDVHQGGATSFPALNLDVQPRRGMAIVFFPATVDGYLDKMALHAANPAVDTKYVSQVWIRQGEYKGQPSKRLPQTMGIPFGQPSLLSGLGSAY
uniref:Fe2OG dioxygenase domain-containing protein n=1 Tax=Grammatophora oceanica TaxID=210454 RepID=A0A7S1UYE3_9STRA|mmetsp:Transcript_29580/g.43619  ORF Transcript_29580/g.43619 Transcript_29580/m.43619 type:complete len:406 (+) Transcript_29580:60-1277(+)|eukprot:CAMPEP_0194030180 /NCGR_PEP_ID=MMETSP0009_2-20130614/3758_1 /TAXON_ID=210454 /ORGANISM="Grammatophora oceanica, Strain CCMP 410" /LENGTH=405 /DNA_ID=CAMNT_0038670083 /DNA_START=17 /DNA_END=1234 /DNA_ORIENTATION=-